MNWQLHSDGSFDLRSNRVTLHRAYPAIDGLAIRPVSVEVHPGPGGGTISYHLAEGLLGLTFGADADGLTISARLSGFTCAPHRLAPISHAGVSGADRFFRQAVGMGGPTTFERIADTHTVLRSHTVSALLASDDTTLVMAALEHRRFPQVSLLTPPQAGSNLISFEAAFHTERIPLPGGTLDLPTLYMRMASKPWDALRTMATAIGKEMHTRTHHPTSYHWCSWYYLYHNLSETLLDEYLAGFAGLKSASPIQSVQIDAGYFPSCGDWLEVNHLFPSGMKPALQKIRKAGYRPGIWIAPFMVGSRSRLFRAHPEWMLRRNNGELVTEWRCYGEPKFWGLPDEETYVLDTSHPDAMAYLRKVFHTFRGWGCEFFKTDFILWGFQDSTQVRRHTPGKTSSEYIRDLLAMIREEIGEESFWLGCIAPYAPFLGFGDGMRIAGDVSPHWNFKELPNHLQEGEGCQYFNNVWWQNDPDAILLREFHVHLNEDESLLHALYQAILGGIINTSDPLHEIRADRLALWRFFEPGKNHWTARIPYLGQKRKLMVAAKDFQNGATAVLVINPQAEAITERLTVQDLVGQPERYVFDWKPGSATPAGRSTHLLPELRRHGVALYYLSPTAEGPAPDFRLGSN